MPSSERRPDLAAMLMPLARTLVAAELPALERAGITVWAYAVLTGLVEAPASTQAALAESIGADRSRVIPVLDELQAKGLIERTADERDRRRNRLRATPAGAEVQARVQADIQRHEEEILALLPAADREALLRALLTLTSLPRETLLSSRGPGPAAR